MGRILTKTLCSCVTALDRALVPRFEMEVVSNSSEFWDRANKVLTVPPLSITVVDENRYAVTFKNNPAVQFDCTFSDQNQFAWTKRPYHFDTEDSSAVEALEDAILNFHLAQQTPVVLLAEAPPK